MSTSLACSKCGGKLRYINTEWVLDAKRKNETAGLHEFECPCGELVIIFLDTDQKEKIAFRNHNSVLPDAGSRFYHF